MVRALSTRDAGADGLFGVVDDGLLRPVPANAVELVTMAREPR